jgi:hypothetical protein
MRRRRWVCAAVLVGALAFGSIGSEAQVKDSPLFYLTTDPSTIRTQIQMALPALERGLQILQSSPDPDEAKRGVGALYDSYRYLRAAQESSSQLNNKRKFPDPVVEIRNQRIWQVRSHLIKCNGAFVPNNPDSISMCAEEASAAVRELRMIIQVFP